eukprot:9466878-Pyramimonas_sp.AAC.1
MGICVDVTGVCVDVTGICVDVTGVNLTMCTPDRMHLFGNLLLRNRAGGRRPPGCTRTRAKNWQRRRRGYRQRRRGGEPTAAQCR